MEKNSSSKLELAWKVYKYIRHKPEVIIDEKIADLLLRATQYLCMTIRNNTTYNTLPEIITYLNTNADKENRFKIEHIVFSDELLSEF